MKRPLSAPILGLAAVTLVGGLALLARSKAPRDEERIETQLSELATDLSVTGHENELVRAARATRLRRYFVEEVRIDLGEKEAVIDGLETLITTAAKYEIPEGGIQVAFVDLRITLEKDQKHANAFTTIRTTRGRDGKRHVDALGMQFRFERRRDFWMISRVAPVETLERLGESLSGGS